MTEILRASNGREVPVVRERLGTTNLWVRADPSQRRWDVSVCRPILEGDEYELAPISIRPDARIKTIVDVGGHIGSFTLRAKLLWPDARVIAAEPDPETATVFRHNTGRLEGIEFHEAAIVRPGIGLVGLRQMGRDGGDGNTAASFVVESVRQLQPEYAATEPTCQVRAMALSQIMVEHGIDRIDILKLDCEGSEPEIIEDLAENGYLARTRYIRGEWHHRRSVERIANALKATHIYNIARSPHPWGFFIAHRPEDSAA